MTKKYKIFISHACADQTLANRFMEFLQSAGSIPRGKIYNTDKTDQQIDNDAYYPQHMLDALKNSDVVIFLISNNFLNRPNCSIELGAALAQNKEKVYLLVHPVTHENLPGFLAGKQAGGNIDDEKTLWNLREALSSCIEKEEGKTAHWNEQCDQFKDDVKGILNGINQIARITQEEFDEQKTKADNYKRLLESKKEELKSLQDKYEKVKNAKDASEVREIERESMDDAKKYERLVQQAKDALSCFSPSMKSFFYAHLVKERNEIDVYDYECWSGEIKENLRKSYIELDGNSYSINKSNNKISRALDVLRELNIFLNMEDCSKCSENEQENRHSFLVSLKKEYDFPVELTNEDYWNKLFC